LARSENGGIQVNGLEDNTMIAIIMEDKKDNKKISLKVDYDNFMMVIVVDDNAGIGWMVMIVGWKDEIFSSCLRRKGRHEGCARAQEKGGRWRLESK
jgi:hypothetical protein